MFDLNFYDEIRRRMNFIDKMRQDHKFRVEIVNFGRNRDKTYDNLTLTVGKKGANVRFYGSENIEFTDYITEYSMYFERIPQESPWRLTSEKRIIENDWK